MTSPSPLLRRGRSTPSRKEKEPLSAETSDLLMELRSSEQDIDTVHALLDQGADPNGRSEDGRPALGVAVGAGWVEAAEALLDAGAAVNVSYGSDGRSLLHEAVRLGPPAATALLHLLLSSVSSLFRWEVREAWYRHGASVEASDGRGESAQALAIRLEHNELADILAAAAASAILAGKA